MQRKLSEIAEIPKILSSTLATVSQTFDKLMPGVADTLANTNTNTKTNINITADQQCLDMQYEKQQPRKFSYDEDAIDYALNDVGGGDDDSSYDDVAAFQSEKRSENSTNNESNEIQRDLNKLSLKLRDLTPESDYASSESDNDIDYDDEFDDDANDAVLNAAGNVCEVDDFLTTSFTWRMRKVPKLFLNDQPSGNCGENAETFMESSDDEENTTESTSDDIELSVRLPAPPKTAEEEKPENCVKLGPLELSWPWADRTKVIYKQSTCHLVPRKCGIIEKSKQLLAKQHLFDAHEVHKVDS